MRPRRRLEQRNARRLPAGRDVPAGGPARHDALAGPEQFNEVHVEAGASLSGALVSAGCVDELLLYLAPVLLGDAAGMVRLPLLEHLDGARRYAFIDTAAIGPDLRLRARVEASWQLLQRVALPDPG